MTASLEQRRVYSIYKDALGNPKGNQRISIELLRDVFADGLSIPQDTFEIFTSNEAGHVGEYEANLYTVTGSFLNYKIKFPTKDKQPIRISVPPGADIPIDTLINLENVPEALPLSLELLSVLMTLIGSYVLTGISFASSAAVTFQDTIISAAGKLQRQINNMASVVAGHTIDLADLELDVDDIYDVQDNFQAEIDSKVALNSDGIALTAQQLIRADDDGRAVDSSITDGENEITFSDKPISRFSPKVELRDQIYIGGYYFATDDNGKLLVFPDDPSLFRVDATTLPTNFSCVILLQAAGNPVFTAVDSETFVNHNGDNAMDGANSVVTITGIGGNQFLLVGNTITV